MPHSVFIKCFFFLFFLISSTYFFSNVCVNWTIIFNGIILPSRMVWHHVEQKKEQNFPPLLITSCVDLHIFCHFESELDSNCLILKWSHAQARLTSLLPLCNSNRLSIFDAWNQQKSHMRLGSSGLARPVLENVFLIHSVVKTGVAGQVAQQMSSVWKAEQFWEHWHLETDTWAWEAEQPTPPLNHQGFTLITLLDMIPF